MFFWKTTDKEEVDKPNFTSDVMLRFYDIT